MDRNRNDKFEKGYTPKQQEERGYIPRTGQINNGYQPSINTNANPRTTNIPEPKENEEV